MTDLATYAAARRANLATIAAALTTLGEAYRADRQLRLDFLRGLRVTLHARDALRMADEQFDVLLLGTLKAAGFEHLLVGCRHGAGEMAGKDFATEAGTHLDRVEAQLTLYTRES